MNEALTLAEPSDSPSQRPILSPNEVARPASIHYAPSATSQASTLGRLASSASSELMAMEIERTVTPGAHSGRCTRLRQRIALLINIFAYPVRARRVPSHPPPFAVSPARAVKLIDAFHGVEIIEVSSQLIVMATFLFHVMRIPPSEIRERIVSWLTVLLALLSLRCILVAFLLEQGRTIFRTGGGEDDIRTAAISLIRSSKTAAARWLYLTYLGWFSLGWQILWIYRNYKRHHPSPPPYTIRFNNRRSESPPVSHDPLEKLTMELMGYLLMGSLVLGFLHLCFVLTSVFYLIYRKELSISAWMTLLNEGFDASTSDNIGAWGRPVSAAGGGLSFTQRSIPRHALKSFPLVQWKNEWMTTQGESSGTTDSLGRLHGTGNYCCCSVCLLPFEECNVVRVLPCAHVFHQSCIDTWLASHSDCPLRCAVNLYAEFDGDFGSLLLEDRLPSGLAQLLRARTKRPFELASTTASPPTLLEQDAFPFNRS